MFKIFCNHLSQTASTSYAPGICLQCLCHNPALLTLSADKLKSRCKVASRYHYAVLCSVLDLQMWSLFDTSAEMRPLSLLSFTFCCLATPFHGCSDGKWCRRCPEKILLFTIRRLLNFWGRTAWTLLICACLCWYHVALQRVSKTQQSSLWSNKLV